VETAQLTAFLLSALLMHYHCANSIAPTLST
jgi:hypothetical protein